jgi:hypothetical protein
LNDPVDGNVVADGHGVEARNDPRGAEIPSDDDADDLGLGFQRVLPQRRMGPKSICVWFEGDVVASARQMWVLLREWLGQDLVRSVSKVTRRRQPGNGRHRFNVFVAGGNIFLILGILEERVEGEVRLHQSYRVRVARRLAAGGPAVLRRRGQRQEEAKVADVTLKALERSRN